jgi:chaperonin GroEL (HSP60 family)
MEQAAVEEGIVVGGGCALLRLSSKVDAIKDTLENYEQKVCLHLLENRFFALPSIEGIFCR